LNLFESNIENISSRGDINDKMRSAATALVALKEHSPLQLSNGRLLCFCFGCSEKDDTCETYFTRSRINTNNDILLCSAFEIVRCKIITKVFHARSNIAFQKYKDEHTGRFATKRKKESGLAFRQELKSVTSRKKDDDKENQSNIVNETSTKKTKKRKTKSSAKKQAEAILLKK